MKKQHVCQNCHQTLYFFLSILKSPIKVMISYQSDHKPQVNALVKRLKERENFDVWHDRDNLKGGCNLRQEIVKKIKNCDMAICCSTSKYLESTCCKNEAASLIIFKKSVGFYLIFIFFFFI